MKQTLLLLFAIFFIAVRSFATSHTIIVADYSFSPSPLTINMGDTLMWVWSSGTHTTTSTTIPSGATAWNANINSSSTTFMYVPTVAGTYNYQCNFHVSMGMTGSFTVSTTGVPLNNSLAALSLYPNPASNTIHIALPFLLSSNPYSTQVSILDMEGRQLFSETYQTQNIIDINIPRLDNGMYFIHILYDKNSYMQKLLIAH